MLCKLKKKKTKQLFTGYSYSLGCLWCISVSDVSDVFVVGMVLYCDILLYNKCITLRKPKEFFLQYF